VDREGHLDRLTVKVESDPGVAGQQTICDQAGRDLQQRIKSYIGVTASVMICQPGTVVRSVGKAKRVIDART
jgi:phenylacetate-CoA ligase